MRTGLGVFCCTAGFCQFRIIGKPIISVNGGLNDIAALSKAGGKGIVIFDSTDQYAVEEEPAEDSN